jgi:hypothetical protein
MQNSMVVEFSNEAVDSKSDTDRKSAISMVLRTNCAYIECIILSSEVSQKSFSTLTKYSSLTGVALFTSIARTARVTLIVTKDTRSSSTTVDIGVRGMISNTTTPGSSVSMDNTGTLKLSQGSQIIFDTNSKLVLVGTVRAVKSCATKWEVSDPLINLRSLASTALDVTLDGSKNKPVTHTIYLSLPANVLPAGSSLVFQLSCSSSLPS